MLKSFHTSGVIEAGCDEAGRGCLAGPVFAAAVILPDNFHAPNLNDSKLLTRVTRDSLRLIIEENAISYGIGITSEKEIDQINILRASILAMQRALEKLNEKPEHIIVDGNRFWTESGIRFTCVIKGDAIYKSIAAASVLAKTHRDEYMEVIHKQYPQYYWDSNKGYPTKAHRKALAELGPTEHHRRSFRLLDEQMLLNIK